MSDPRTANPAPLPPVRNPGPADRESPERVEPCYPHHFVWVTVPEDPRVAFVGTCSFCGTHRVDLHPWRRRVRLWAAQRRTRKVRDEK